MISLVRKLQSRSKVQPIILLQADEGPYPDRYRLNEQTFMWRDATISELRQKMEILNAYYMPGIDSLPLFPAVTPVNSLRIVLNCYFGTNLKLFPDRIFAHENDRYPYSFFDITDQLNR